MTELDAQHRCLQGVEPRVDPDPFMKIRSGAAMNSQRLQAPGKGLVVCGDHATVAVTSQILGGVKAERAKLSHAASPAILVFGANRLRGVFDDGDTAFRGYRTNRIHIRAPSKQMDGNDGANLRMCSQSIRHLAGIEIECLLFDVNEHRVSTEP